MSLLGRDPRPADLEAEREPPRPGVWAGEPGADLRALTQDETDWLIRCELMLASGPDEEDEVARVCGLTSRRALALDGRRFILVGADQASVRTQRGGIDSDPLVRVLARRAWGDRDRRWFELRGVRKGEAVALSSAAVDADAALAWPTDHVHGVALSDARPGERVDVRSRRTDSVRLLRVGDRLREPPPWSSATPEEVIADLEAIADDLNK